LVLQHSDPPSFEIPSSLSTGGGGGVYIGIGALAATAATGLVGASNFSCYRNTDAKLISFREK
jgi:hypothetical protein